MARKLIGVAVALGLLLTVITLGVANKRPLVSTRTAIIGFITPLSGARASIGEDARAAAELALAELSENRGGSPVSIEIHFEDSQGDPAKGVAAFQKLAADGAVAVVTQNSNVSLPISAIANRLQVVQLAITTTSDRFTTPSDFVFRTNGTTLEEARLMAQFLADRQKNKSAKIGIVVMRDEYPEMLHQHLVDELKLQALTAVVDEEYLPTETDFRTTLAKFRERGAMQIVCLGYQVQCGQFVKQLREMRIDPDLILVNTPVNNREFFVTAGEGADGVFSTYPKPDLTSKVAQQFLKQYGREMNFFSSNAYDAVRILAGAAHRCENDITPECLRQELNRSPSSDGPSGKKHFDINGDMQDNYTLLVAKGGKFAPL